jgi:ribonuclease HI
MTMTDYPGHRWHVYTDGSGMSDAPGGYAAVCIEVQGVFTNTREYVGFYPETTSQRMELTAAIRALEMIPPNNLITVFSDSAYLVNGMNEKWFSKWKKKGWRNSKGEVAKNLDLWRELITLAGCHMQVEWVHVPGHQPDNSSPHALGNNRADWLAGQARRYGMAQGLSEAVHWAKRYGHPPERGVGLSGAPGVSESKLEGS